MFATLRLCPLHSIYIGALILLTLGSTSCTGRSMDEVLKKHRAEGKPTLEKIQKIGLQVQKISRLMKGANILGKEKIIYDGRGDKGNSCLLYLRDFGGPDEFKLSAPVRINDDDRIVNLHHLVEKGKPLTSDMSPGRAKKAFEYLKGVEYVLVIRHYKFQDPKVEKKTKKFDRGYFEGELHFYRLKDGKYLGGFPFNALMPQQVKVKSLRMEAGLREIMERELRKSIISATKKVAPHFEVLQW